jgi:hypothetical protein
MAGCAGASEVPSAAPVRNPAALVEGQPYAQQLDPADFVAAIDNRYFPLTPGTTLIYEGGGERIEVTVTHDTREILGITASVVHDQVTVDGQVTEDTYDWYAQDRWGNVWYLGEDTKEYEDGVVTSTEGTWEAGVDGAQPGIVMLAEPAIGDVYRQEYYAGEAEDAASIFALDQTTDITWVTGGTQPAKVDGVLVTEEWTPLDPAVREHKSYAPGVGLIREESVTGGNVIVLIEIRVATSVY